MPPQRFASIYKRRISYQSENSTPTQEPPGDEFGAEDELNGNQRQSRRKRISYRNIKETSQPIQQPSEDELVAEYERNMNIFCFTFQICLIIYAFVVIAYAAIQYYLEPISTPNKGEY